MPKGGIINNDGHFVFSGSLPADLLGYRTFYRQSIEKKKEFWEEQGKKLAWKKPFTSIFGEDMSIGICEWFADGTLNASYNALDVHVEAGRGDDDAIIYVSPDKPAVKQTYKTLLEDVKALANAMAAQGLKSGDRVAIYLPDSPQKIVFILAAARIGCIYVPIPTRFAAQAAIEDLADCKAAMLVVGTGFGLPAYEQRAETVINSIKGTKIVTVGERPLCSCTTYNQLIEAGKKETGDPIEFVDSERPLLIQYATSAGGIPRGSVFATGGFLVQTKAAYSYQIRNCDDKKKKVYVALSTSSSAGQSYGIWGPLLYGDAIVIAEEGEESITKRMKRILNEYAPSVMIAQPRLLGGLKFELSDKPFESENKFSLIALSGDALPPRLITFATKNLCKRENSVINLWMQAETGCALISTYAGEELNKTGSLGLPFPGVEPEVINDFGEHCKTNEPGQLVFAATFPSMARTIWGQNDRFKQLYFARVPKHFYTNDGVRADNNNFFWFMGRLDDVIKLEGMSIATSELEATLSAHAKISESAVVGVTGEDGERISVFVVVKPEHTPKDEVDEESLRNEIMRYIEKRVGEFARPYKFLFVAELPRTRSGKVVRRLLRRIVNGDVTINEDMSHVTNPDSVVEIIKRSEK